MNSCIAALIAVNLILYTRVRAAENHLAEHFNRQTNHLEGVITMTAQDQINTVTEQLGRVYSEVTTQADDLRAKIADVQAQLDAANVPAETVDLTALNAAAQKLDDIVSDAPVTETPVE